MGRHLAVLFSDLERHSDAWHRVPRERMVAAIAEYRYVAESLAGQYGCLYREWAGDGHMFLFESPGRRGPVWPEADRGVENRQRGTAGAA